MDFGRKKWTVAGNTGVPNVVFMEERRRQEAGGREGPAGESSKFLCC